MNSAAQLIINEVCADNESIVEDEFGDYSDWIELYNLDNTPINLNGYYLSDEVDDPQKWEFPNVTIGPNEYLLIFASDQDVFDIYAHTNFKLSKNGETLLLSNHEGILLDQIDIPSLGEDVSYGRFTANFDNWTYFNSPTPGAPNDVSSVFDFNEKPIFTLTEYFHTEATNITIATANPNGTIRYTTDGTLPDENSLLYDGPISADATICIRASVFSDDLLPSKVSSSTYFFNVDHTLPILAMTTDPFLLYDWEDGIFVDGPDADSLYPYYGANFWKDITIPMHIAYYKEENLVANFDVGSKIHGGRTSRSKPMKSLRFLADTEYGAATMDYPFFEDRENDSYKRLVLRNASGDFNYTHCRDAYLQRYFMAENLNLDVLAYQPVAAYLNGAYFGLMNLREKVDRYYIGNQYDVDIDNIDLLEEDDQIVEGNFAIFDEMLDFVTSNDLSDEAIFTEVAKSFDLENIADYMIAQTAVNNTDWPSNNLKYWRERKEGSKWRYLLFDMDAAMGRAGYTKADKDSFGQAMASEWDTDNKFVHLFRGLLENEGFKNYFLNRYADLLNTTFKTERMYEELDLTVAAIDEEIFRHFEIWGWPGYEVWKDKRLPGLYDFSRDRPSFARQFLMDYFELDNEVNLKLNVFPPEAGTIQMNTINIDELPWDGYYFNGVPVTLTIIPNPGYTFRHWQSVNTVLTPNPSTVLQSNFLEDDEITAFFEAASLPLDISIAPNPVFDEIQMTFILDEVNPLQVNLYDISGRLLSRYDFGRVGGGLQTRSIDGSHLSQGVYLLEVKTATDTVVKKFIKI